MGIDLRAWETERGCHFLVVMMDAEEDEHQYRHQHDNKPRAPRELGNRKHHHDDEREYRTNSTDDLVEAPVLLVMQIGFKTLDDFAWLELPNLVVADDHTRLRNGEAQEDADRIEWDEERHACPADDDEKSCEQR